MFNFTKISKISKMSKNVTFSMIKPDGVENQYIGAILEKICKAGFKILALKLSHLTKNDAELFYNIHKEKPFYNDLVSFITRGPIVVMVLEKENAVDDFRTLIGSTNPIDAAEGTIRKIFAESVGENVIHGSDSDENALIESRFHFSSREIFNKK